MNDVIHEKVYIEPVSRKLRESMYKVNPELLGYEYIYWSGKELKDQIRYSWEILPAPIV